MATKSKFTVYARLEPTTDSATVQHAPERMKEKGWHDVCIYKDEACTEFYCRFPHHYSTKPTRRNKYVNINCFRYNLVWVPEAREQPDPVCVCGKTSEGRCRSCGSTPR